MSVKPPAMFNFSGVKETSRRQRRDVQHSRRKGDTEKKAKM
jgi:hypothetical protein